MVRVGILLLAALAGGVGSASAAEVSFTLYGLERSYRCEERLLGFDQPVAFPGDKQEWSTDDFCRTEPFPPKPEGAFRLLSFNVHNFHKVCGSTSPRKHPRHAMEVIRRARPDFVALQEVVPYQPSGTFSKSDFHRGPRLARVGVDFSVLDGLMENLGFPHGVKVSDFEHANREKRPRLIRCETPEGHRPIFMGKAFYSRRRLDPGATAAFPLGHSDGFTDRSALRTVIDVHGRALVVYNVHLSFSGKPDEARKREIIDLVRLIDRDQRGHVRTDRELPILIMGDFNSDPDSEPSVFAPLRRSGFRSLGDDTVSGFNQNAPIDQVWVNPAVENLFTVLNPKTSDSAYRVVVRSDASDHYPLYVDLAARP